MALTISYKDIMKRFKNILDTSKRKNGVVLTVLLLCMSVVLCGLVGCESKDENSISQTDTVLRDEISDGDDDAIIADIVSKYTDEGYMDAQTAMELVNEYRVQNGLQELIIGDAKLNEIALIRLEESMEKFSHTRPNGKAWRTVYDEEGLTYTYACENLARGQETAVQVVEDWINSTAQRENLLDPNVEYMHIACEMGKAGTGLENYIYWVFEAYSD